MTQTTPEQSRIAWADTAKAISILLVVFYHVVPTGMGWLVEGTSTATEIGQEISRFFGRVRIPLFFLVSGILARNALKRSFSRSFRSRVLNYLWVFWLWTLLYVYPQSQGAGQSYETPFLRMFGWLINLNGAYWFIPALVVFFILTKVTVRLPSWLVTSLAMLTVFIAPLVPEFEGEFLSDIRLTLTRLMGYFIWYAIGSRGAEVLDWLTRNVKYFGLPAAVLYIVGYVAADGQPLPTIGSVGMTTLGLLAIVGLSQLLSLAHPIRRLSRYIAGRTLPIYLFHALIVALMIWFIPTLAPLTSAQAAVLISVWTLGLTAVACIFWDLLRPWLPWLFAAPQWLIQLTTRTTSHAESEDSSHKVRRAS